MILFCSVVSQHVRILFRQLESLSAPRLGQRDVLTQTQRPGTKHYEARCATSRFSIHARANVYRHKNEVGQPHCM